MSAHGLGGPSVVTSAREVESAFEVQDLLADLPQLVPRVAVLMLHSDGLPYPLVAVAGGQSAGKSSL